MLSFGEEAEEEEQELATTQSKMKSAYAFPSKLIEESKSKKRRNPEKDEGAYSFPEDYAVCARMVPQSKMKSTFFILCKRNGEQATAKEIVGLFKWD